MVIAYLPLIVLLLPLKAAAIGSENTLTVLSSALLVGGISASISNIVAGWISDRIFAETQSRVGQILVGLAATVASYWVFAHADTWTGLLMAIAVFQACLNLFFSPLSALLADKIPNHAKARGAAMVNLSLPIGSLVIAGLALAPFGQEHIRLIIISIAVALLIAPICILALGLPNIEAETMAEQTPHRTINEERSDLSFVWLARFSVQVAAAIMFGYFLLYLKQSLQLSAGDYSSSAEDALGSAILVAAPTAIIACLVFGFLGDRWPQFRAALMMIASAVIAVALGVLVTSPAPQFALAAYIALTAGITCYLAIDNAVVTQLLLRSRKRARTLGIMNLANAIPSVIAPAIALGMSAQGLSNSALLFLFQIGAILAFLATILIPRIRSARMPCSEG